MDNGTTILVIIIVTAIIFTIFGSVREDGTEHTGMTDKDISVVDNEYSDKITELSLPKSIIHVKDIKDLDDMSIEDAISICKRSGDSCFHQLAIASEDQEICKNIIQKTTKDACLVYFMSKNMLKTCDAYNNRYLKTSCHTLQALRKIK